MNGGNETFSPASIKFLTGPLAGRTFAIDKPVTTIGRNPGNDIVVQDDQRVSRQHVRLLWNNESWIIEKHPQTTSIVTVNRQSVQHAVLSNGTTVGLGDVTSFLFLIHTNAQSSSVSIPRQPASQLPFADSQPASPPIHRQSTPLNTPLGVSSVPIQQPDSTEVAQPLLQPDQTQLAPLAEMGVASLEVTNNTSIEKHTYILNQDVINIGRDPSNDIVIKDRIVSSFHAQIVRDGNHFVLIHPHPDRQQTLNGLFYLGRKIRSDEPFRKQLVRNDIFRIGDEHGTFVTLSYNDGSGAQQEVVPEVRPIPLGVAEITIGRLADNTVILPHPQISGHHVRLVREKGSYQIIDLRSTNHVYVNGERVTNQLLKLGDVIRVGPYKLTYTGQQLVQFDESNYIHIDALQLKKFGNKHVSLIHDISLSIPSSKFVALVGGSGAGKSMLMDALNGLRPAQQGKVFYNGQDYYRNLAAFSTQIGYVPQDDIVHRALTVERALYYAAKLRLPSDFTNEQIQQRISEVLEDVEMTGRRKLLISKLSGGQRKRVSIALELLANPSVFFLDEPTSGLDPGLDRKMMFLLRRLADKGHTIVLVTHATNNINTCDYVCFLAQEGRLAYFGPPDEARSYFGKSDFAEIYTTLEPDEQHPDIPQEAEAKFKLSREYQQYVAAPLEKASTNGDHREHLKIQQIKRTKRGNPFRQFILLVQRNIELLKNDRSTLIILLLQAPLIALLLMLLVRFEVGGGIFDTSKVVQCAPRIFTSSAVSSTNPTGSLGINTNGNNTPIDCNRMVNFLKNDPNGIVFAQSKSGVNPALQDFIVSSTGSLDAQRALFIISFIAVLFGCINGTREIVKESSIYRRERTVNLGIIPYVFSKIVVLGMFSLYQCAAIVIIVDLFEPLQESIFLPVLLEFYITLVLTALAGLVLGLAASAFAANEDSANVLLPFLLIPQVIFAGVEIPLKHWGLQIIASFFPTRWSMVALGSSAGLHSDILGSDTLFGSDTTYHGILFSTFSQSDAMHRLLLAWAALVALIIFYTILLCIGLKRKDSRT
jgi:ABC-type multidrug transport system ATPase subunit/pSer/pThr/pTyr-binding forkhead associated (FHA) protein